MTHLDVEEDAALLRGFKLVGTLLLFFIFMVFLRFLVNGCIDVAVLRNPDSLIRKLSQIRRFLCPWWHPRTQPQDMDTAANGTRDVAPSSENRQVNMDQLLMGLTVRQKHELLSIVLKSKAAEEKDLKMDYSEDDQSSCASKVNSPSTTSSHSACDDPTTAEDLGTINAQSPICPICIHEIEVDDQIIALSSTCNHRFHSDCLVQWLSTHTRLCPYCRTEIITQEMLDQAFLTRQLHFGRNCRSLTNTSPRDSESNHDIDLESV